jgi:hypothetical protein
MMVSPSQLEAAIPADSQATAELVRVTAALRDEAEAMHRALDADLVRDHIAQSIETVTPERAAGWLTRNPANRSLSDGLVGSYARDMAAGRWQVNGEAICFDVSGLLINGQHRLYACVMANTPFITAVVRGLPSQARDTMDQGRPRKAADILKMNGASHVYRLAGAARFLLLVKAGMESGDASMYHQRASTGEILELIGRHPKLVDSAYNISHARGISQSHLMGVHYVGTHLQGQGELANAFAEVFTNGIPAYPSDPAHRLREKNLAVRKRFAASPKESTQFYSIIKAWNLFRRGQPLGKFPAPRAPIYFDELDPSLI